MIKITEAFIKQLWLTMGASLAFLIIGLVRGYSASALPSIATYDSHLIQNSEQKSWIGAIPPLGAFCGSMISGTLMQKYGRKRTLQLTAPLWGASWLLLGFAPSFPVVLAGRFLTGLCVGFVLATAQVYVSECCDPEIRGSLGSLPSLSMSLGILISYISGSLLYWRYLAFLSASFCGGLFVILIPLPESPVWLEANGKDPSPAIKWLILSARATEIVAQDDDDLDIKKKKLSKLNMSKQKFWSATTFASSAPLKPVLLLTQKPSDIIKPLASQCISGKGVNDEPPQSLFSRKVFFSPVVIKPMTIGFALLIFQQFSGIDSVVFFTVEIFKSAGSTLDAMTATVIVGVVQLLSNAVSTFLVDRVGRRPLLLISAVIMCASMGAMGAAFYFDYDKASFLGYLPICSLVVFMMGFSLGFGGLPFLLLGELFPAHHRSQLSAMASAVNLLSMFSVIKSYHALENVLTSAGTFWMYACFCCAAFFFVLFLVPETKGKSLAEIEKHFRGKKPKKQIEPIVILSTKF